MSETTTLVIAFQRSSISAVALCNAGIFPTMPWTCVGEIKYNCTFNTFNIANFLCIYKDRLLMIINGANRFRTITLLEVDRNSRN